MNGRSPNAIRARIVDEQLLEGRELRIPSHQATAVPR